MRKIFGKITLLLLVFSVTLSFASCHGTLKDPSDLGISEKDDTPDFTVEGYDPNKTYNIVFWAKNDSNNAQREIYKKAIADFEALYPNIKIKMKTYTDYGRIYSDVITNISTGTTPNICITYPDHVATYLSGSSLVVPLDSLISDEKYGLGGSELRFDGVTEDEIVKEFLNEGKIDGTQYALPFMRSTEACYVNKTYIEALGYTLPETLTWDFIWEVSEAALSQNSDGTYKVNGQKVMIPFIYKSTDNMMIQMLAQKDASYSNDNGEILIFNDECEEILMRIYTEAKKGSFSTFKISSYPGNYFNRGQCIFAIDSTAGASWMGADAPLIDIPEEELVEFETAVMEIPQFNTDSPKMISQGPSMCLFSKEDSGEVIASWLFMQFLLTDGVQISYSETEGYVPVTEKAQGNPDYLNYLSRAGENNDLYYNVKISAAKLLLENTENTFVTSVFNGSTALRNAAGEMIEDVTKEARRNGTVNSAYINELYERMTKLYKLDEIVQKNESEGKRELGALPPAAIALIVGVLAVDLILVAVAVRRKIKNKK